MEIDQYDIGNININDNHNELIKDLEDAEKKLTTFLTNFLFKTIGSSKVLFLVRG